MHHKIYNVIVFSFEFSVKSIFIFSILQEEMLKEQGSAVLLTRAAPIVGMECRSLMTILICLMAKLSTNKVYSYTTDNAS